MSDQLIGPHNPDVLEEEVSDEVVLYDPNEEVFVALNATAADVWRMATGEFTLHEMVGRLAAAYGVDPDRIRPDVKDTVRQLSEAGLIIASQP